MANRQDEYSYEAIHQIAEDLLSRTGCRPQVGVICGSGLGALADLVTDKTVIPYQDIPAFPVSTVSGHAGELVLGRLRGKDVVLMKGRTHLYEGYSVHKLAVPVRTMQLMGVKVLVVTNAAGGLNDSFHVGDVMLIKDHFNAAGFAGANPLVGFNDERFGPRFPPMSDAYDPRLRQLARSVAKELGFESFVKEGVYSFIVGPNYETICESHFFKQIGVDAVGMSTVPEVLVARHGGLRVLGLSLITNQVQTDYRDDHCPANHHEVLQAGQARANDLQALVSRIVERIDL